MPNERTRRPHAPRRNLSDVLWGVPSNILAEEVLRPNPLLASIRSGVTDQILTDQILTDQILTDQILTASEDDAPIQESRAYIPRAVRNDWRTPDSVLEVIRASLAGEIALDPCASTEHWLAGGDEIGQDLNFHEEDDGLTLNWHAKLTEAAPGNAPTVYVNPPFNRNKDWVAKCREEAARGCEVVMLIPARVDTRYWQDGIATSASAICFWRGRIKFIGADQGAPFPCALVYWGPNAERFVEVMRGQGHHAVLNGQRIA